MNGGSVIVEFRADNSDYPIHFKTHADRIADAGRWFAPAIELGNIQCDDMVTTTRLYCEIITNIPTAVEARSWYIHQTNRQHRYYERDFMKLAWEAADQKKTEVILEDVTQVDDSCNHTLEFKLLCNNETRRPYGISMFLKTNTGKAFKAVYLDGASVIQK